MHIIATSRSYMQKKKTISRVVAKVGLVFYLHGPSCDRELLRGDYPAGKLLGVPLS